MKIELWVRRLAIFLEKAAAAVCVTVLSGCVPVMTTYADFDLVGVQYIHEPGLGKLSPPRMIYYPYHGIHISFDLQLLALGLHLPSGATVQLNDNQIQIKGMTRGAAYDATLTISAAPHKWIFNPTQFLGEPDPYHASDNTAGPLVGPANGERSTWYLFMVRDPKDSRRLARTPQGLTNGTVRLPSLTINGQRYEGQILSFRQKKFAGFECGLCN